MNIGRKSVRTLAQALASGWKTWLSQSWQRAELARNVEELVNAVVARDLAKARKGKHGPKT